MVSGLAVLQRKFASTDLWKLIREFHFDIYAGRIGQVRKTTAV